jgi:hypothetical protein
VKTRGSEEKLLSIELLGTPKASFEGRTLHLPTKKALALLCYWFLYEYLKDTDHQD